MKKVTSQRIRQVLNSACQRRVVVVGDVMVMMDADGRIAALRVKAIGEEASGARVRGGGGGGSGGGGDTPTNRSPGRSRPGL